MRDYLKSKLDPLHGTKMKVTKRTMGSVSGSIHPRAGAGAGSSTQGWSSTDLPVVRTHVGGDWILDFHFNTAFVPVMDAATGIVMFYDYVTTDALAQLAAGAAEVGSLVYTLGGIALRLACAHTIHWDLVIEFAKSMVDLTNTGNPVQYAASVFSVEQQEIIQADLTLGGKRLSR